MRALSLLLLACSVVPLARSQHFEWLDGSSPPCSVDELVPLRDEVAEQWSSRMVDTKLFDCSCPLMKASYYCPHLQFSGYPVWEPKAVAEGLCSIMSLEQLRESPFPPNSRVLVHGNSHLRQPVEGIMCMFKDALKSRLVTRTNLVTREQLEDVVDPDVQCRGCVGSWEACGLLLELDHCISEGSVEEACGCDDNVGEFEFLNGARVQYYFAHRTENKVMSDALRVRDTKFEDYDFIIGNAGNPPSMRAEGLMQSVREIRAAGVPFLWLSTYDGTGDIEKLTDSNRAEFFDLGAKFMPVHDMVQDFVNLTKGVVENETNNHYCMPGPPTELGLLILRIIWAQWIGSHPGDSG